MSEWHFSGETYDHDRDGKRLGKQMRAVMNLVLIEYRGFWLTLAFISANVHAPEASVSARLRDLRHPRFGEYTVERRYVANGLHEYRVPPPEGQLPLEGA